MLFGLLLGLVRVNFTIGLIRFYLEFSAGPHQLLWLPTSDLLYQIKHVCMYVCMYPQK